MVLHLLTNLPEEISALLGAELYRRRWSIETLFYEVTQTMKQVQEGMMIALPPEEWAIFRSMSVAKFAAKLKELAAHMDLDYYHKSKRGPKHPLSTRDKYRHGGQVSTHKLLKNKDP